jgi:hypothetical protein
MLHCSMRSKFSNVFFYFQQDFLALNFCSLDIWTKVVYLHTHFTKCKSSINKSVCFFKDAHEKQMLQLVKLLMCLIMYKQISMFLKDAHEIQKLQLVKLLIFLMMHKIKSVIYCCLTPSEKFFSPIMMRTNCIFNVCLMVFNATFNSTIFQLYRGGQFYWWRTQRKPLTCRMLLTNFIT